MQELRRLSGFNEFPGLTSSEKSTNDHGWDWEVGMRAISASMKALNDWEFLQRCQKSAQGSTKVHSTSPAGSGANHIHKENRNMSSYLFKPNGTNCHPIRNNHNHSACGLHHRSQPESWLQTRARLASGSSSSHPELFWGSIWMRQLAAHLTISVPSAIRWGHSVTQTSSALNRPGSLLRDARTASKRVGSKERPRWQHIMNLSKANTVLNSHIGILWCSFV